MIYLGYDALCEGWRRLESREAAELCIEHGARVCTMVRSEDVVKHLEEIPAGSVVVLVAPRLQDWAPISVGTRVHQGIEALLGGSRYKAVALQTEQGDVRIAFSNDVEYTPGDEVAIPKMLLDRAVKGVSL